MNLLKQLSIFSIIILSVSQGVIAMDAPEGEKPAEAASGSWFNGTRIAGLGAGVAAAAAAGWRYLSPENRARVTGTVAQPMVAVPALVTAGFGLAYFGHGFITGSEAADSQALLEITDEERELLGGSKVKLTGWQTKLLAIMVKCSNENKTVLIEQVRKLTNPHEWLKNRDFMSAFTENKQLDAFLIVLKAYAKEYAGEVKTRFAQLLTEEQMGLVEIIAQSDLAALLTEKQNKSKLTVTQVEWLEAELKVLDVLTRQQNVLVGIIAQAKK